MNQILTDLYRMEHLPESKSKSRMDCTASTRSYPEFEELRNKAGNLFFYFHKVPEHFGKEAKRKADMAITRTKSISSVFVPDIAKLLGYGDIKHTTDALLFVFSANLSQMDVFVARGQRHNQTALYQLLADNAFKEEMQALINRAKPEN
jgi:hypothetical protein